MNIEGIKGLEGREPIGVAISIGRKKDGGGYPIEKDRFHIVQPFEANGVREPHPVFASFAKAPAERRRILRGVLVHRTRRECFESHLKAQKGPQRGHSHPNRLPWCVGDGERAKRWMGDSPDDFRAIECPNERCQYRDSIGGKPPLCKPWMRLYFLLVWPEHGFPSMLAKFTSGSWNTQRNCVGLLDSLRDNAAALGISDPSYYGFPFTMSLVERTKPSEKTRFPTVVFTPEMSPVEFFMKQRADLRAIGDSTPYAALTDPSEHDPVVVAADNDLISVPRQ